MNPAAEITNIQEYAHLLGDALPHVIHTEAENERCTAVLESILRKVDRTTEENRLAERPALFPKFSKESANSQKRILQNSVSDFASLRPCSSSRGAKPFLVRMSRPFDK